MRKDCLHPSSVKVDGGMVSNNWFTQFLSEILRIKIVKSGINETTALGAAYIAGYQVGIFKSLKHIKRYWKKDRDFKPNEDLILTITLFPLTQYEQKVDQNLYRD